MCRSRRGTSNSPRIAAVIGLGCATLTIEIEPLNQVRRHRIVEVWRGPAANPICWRGRASNKCQEIAAGNPMRAFGLLSGQECRCQWSGTVAVRHIDGRGQAPKPRLASPRRWPNRRIDRDAPHRWQRSDPETWVDVAATEFACMAARVIEVTTAHAVEQHRDQLPGDVSNRGATGDAPDAEPLVVIPEGRRRRPRRDQEHDPEPDFAPGKPVAALAEPVFRDAGARLFGLRVQPSSLRSWRSFWKLARSPMTESRRALPQGGHPGQEQAFLGQPGGGWRAGLPQQAQQHGEPIVARLSLDRRGLAQPLPLTGMKWKTRDDW